MTTLTTGPVEKIPGARQVVVKTAYGAVRGSVADGVSTFKGIPYAAPPFGPHRLRPPEPVEPWSGVRDALTYGAKPPQLPYPPPWDVLIPERGPLGDDCLNLNIWTADPHSVGLPVMVWIPGGMFEACRRTTDALARSRGADQQRRLPVVGAGAGDQPTALQGHHRFARGPGGHPARSLSHRARVLRQASPWSPSSRTMSMRSLSCRV